MRGLATHLKIDSNRRFVLKEQLLKEPASTFKNSIIQFITTAQQAPQWPKMGGALIWGKGMPLPVLRQNPGHFGPQLCKIIVYAYGASESSAQVL